MSRAAAAKSGRATRGGDTKGASEAEEYSIFKLTWPAGHLGPRKWVAVEAEGRKREAGLAKTREVRGSLWWSDPAFSNWSGWR